MHRISYVYDPFLSSFFLKSRSHYASLAVLDITAQIWLALSHRDPPASASASQVLRVKGMCLSA